MGKPQDSIGALWPSMHELSPVPTAEDRRAQIAAMRKPLPEVRHPIRMDYVKRGGVWTVTFSENGKVLRTCRLAEGKIEEAARKGKALTCLADTQALQLGIRQGCGGMTLYLNAEQYAYLQQPL